MIPMTEYDELAKMADELKRLREDRDALLNLRGVLLRISHMVDSGGKWEAVDAAVMHEMAEHALATLPERLMPTSDQEENPHLFPGMNAAMLYPPNNSKRGREE